MQELGHPSSRGYEPVLCILFALVLLGLYSFDAALTPEPRGKIAAMAGRISYSLYLSHPLVISIPQEIRSAKEDRVCGPTYWVSYLAQIAVAIGFAYLFHIAFERPFLSSRPKSGKSRYWRKRLKRLSNELEAPGTNTRMPARMSCAGLRASSLGPGSTASCARNRLGRVRSQLLRRAGEGTAGRSAAELSDGA